MTWPYNYDRWLVVPFALFALGRIVVSRYSRKPGRFPKKRPGRSGLTHSRCAPSMLTMGSEHGNSAASAPPTRFGPNSWTSSFGTNYRPRRFPDHRGLRLRCRGLFGDGNRLIGGFSGQLRYPRARRSSRRCRYTVADHRRGMVREHTRQRLEGANAVPSAQVNCQISVLAAGDYYRLHMLRDTGVTKEKAAALRFNECGGLANGWSCKIHPDGTIEQ